MFSVSSSRINLILYIVHFTVYICRYYFFSCVKNNSFLMMISFLKVLSKKSDAYSLNEYANCPEQNELWIPVTFFFKIWNFLVKFFMCSVSSSKIGPSLYIVLFTVHIYRYHFFTCVKYHSSLMKISFLKILSKKSDP